MASKLDVIENQLQCIYADSSDKMAPVVLELLQYVRKLQGECLSILRQKQMPTKTQPPFSWQVLRSDHSPLKTA